MASILGLSTPAWYAKEENIQAQRFLGLVMLVSGLFATAIAPATGGIIAAVAFPLVAGGSFTVGASLIQEVLGKAYGCSRGKTKRVFAGVCFMIPQPLGWLLGAIFWRLSNRANGR